MPVPGVNFFQMDVILAKHNSISAMICSSACPLSGMIHPPFRSIARALSTRLLQFSLDEFLDCGSAKIQPLQSQLLFDFL